MPPSAALSLPAGRKALATYRALVGATRETIAATGGFAAEQVAERAGMSPATFYSYFPSKEEALAAALDDVLTDLVDRTLAEFSVERLLEDGLRPVLERAVAASLDVFTSGALVLRLALARLPESRTIRHVYRDHQQHATEALRRFVRLGVAAGRLRVADQESATVTLLVALQGLNNPLLLGREPGDPVVRLQVDALEHLLAS